ncbi:MAG TPA: bifunctional phosphopantothenoylcysteine decarboxylase/phosphopantothenate--cysteine ligase CoaBC [Solirubrobacteraceae bacterium]|jgi:phosphopantothenoylcysteine decarboxylase/phosphopantothenate--cysteine ligase|nr:bifunctional phosphopantothenoylcysteine decarboxylase/phosphopantothenate--cysteine ligase CoaBC [Solirubrobacteraceae bacterium]
MSKILLGVSGGIAAYKALELTRLATAAGHSVRVVQTPNSQRFVGAASFAALTGAPVLTDEFEQDPARGAFAGDSPPSHQPLSHLQLVANADLYLIAPASANTIAKLAAGIADNLLCSCALAADCPLALAPAMNNHMYEHAATQANLQTLRSRGVHVIDPDSGRLASLGEHGVGRLAEPARLLAECECLLASAAEDDDGEATAATATSAWRDLRVLISAGGTREPIDEVRFLGNRSSGRMGAALADAARRRGARVTLVGANLAVTPPAGVETVSVATAAELSDACEQRFADCDVLLMAAAVADYRPVKAHPGKIKKGERERISLELERTEDVLAGLAARRRPGQTIVGFAAEHGEEAVEIARSKLARKQLDALVVNDVSRADIGFEADHNEVTILTPGGEQAIARTQKSGVAEAILDAVQRLRAPA